MSAAKRELTAADLISDDDFGKVRKTRRAEILPVKKLRRIPVGPEVTFYFENYDTMLMQVQEMLYIERGGEEQVRDELAAYNPLIPKGNELVATVMIEVADADRRLRVLLGLTHFEKHLFVQVGQDKIYCVPEEDAERTSADGKTSSVHFVRFPFTGEQVKAFIDPANQVMVGVDHVNYNHLAVLSNDSRKELARDF